MTKNKSLMRKNLQLLQEAHEVELGEAREAALVRALGEETGVLAIYSSAKLQRESQAVTQFLLKGKSCWVFFRQNRTFTRARTS